MFLTIIIFLLTLLILVLSHEFGHFIAARRAGIKVLEFGFGLPPRIFGKKVGETTFSLNWLPIGGFVKLFGEDETDDKVLKNDRSFAAQPVIFRIMVVIAGVVMNLLLAIIIFWIVAALQGFKEEIPLFAPYQFIGVNQTNKEVIVVGGVAVGSPAQGAGIKNGDRVIKVNGVKINSVEQLIELAKQNAGQKATLTLIDPSTKQWDVEVTPRKDPPTGEGPLGVQLVSTTYATLSYESLGQKLGAGFIRSYNLSAYSFNILGKLISASIRTRDIEPVSQTLSGPVGITSITSAILQTRSPLLPYLDFVGALSLNLAIINILPFPALDGGRLIFLLTEAVFRRKIKAEIERIIHTAGMAFLIALILLITFSDIRKLLF